VISLRVMSDEEVAADEAAYLAWRAEQDIAELCHQGRVAMCEAHGGHAWRLQIDPADGKDLTCDYCPACMDDLHPDGFDCAVGDFEVYPGYVLTLRLGFTRVNDRDYDGLHTYGWRGRVSARVEVEHYPATPDHGEEWDVWVVLEAL
jgi:hypothetical protein